MKINPFDLERYFAKYEFSTKYLLSSSECHALGLKELLEMADAETMGMYESLSLGYTQSSGHPLLLREISGMYDTADPEDIFVAAPQEGIFIAENVLLEKGDHMISVFPGYQSSYEVGRSIGCDVSYWKVRYGENGPHFDIGDLKALIRNDTKLIVINFPHNPTGYLPPYDEYIEIFDIARKAGAWVLSDEMYRYLERRGQGNLPFACDVYEKAVSLFGLSKTFALPGLRIGWLCGRNRDVISKCKQFRDYLTICNSAPSEILAIMALRAKERILTRNREIIDCNLKIVRGFFKSHEDRFSFYEPKGGSICYPKLKGEIKTSDFCAGLAMKNEVMLLPCDVFGEENNRFRLGYGRKDLPQATEALENYLKENL